MNVGLTTTAHYGRRVAWIGNVVVKRQYRQRHIGLRLVEHAVNYLTEMRVKHIALYCFKENVAFYRRLGFVAGPGFVRLRREYDRRPSQVEVEASSKTVALSSILALDAKGFGADRHRLFTSLLREGFAWYLTYHSGSGASYLLVKKYHDMNEIGPWIAFGLNSRELDLLLRVVIRKSGRKPIEVTCPNTNDAVLRMMKRQGFHSVNEGRVMYFRQITVLGRPKAIVAHGFLDKG